MRIIESRSIDNQAGLLGSRLITGTSTIEGAFQSFIVAEDTIVSKVYNSIGIDVTQKLGLTSVTLKAGAFISMAKGDYFSSIKLTSGSVVAYFVSHGGKTITADAYLNEFLARTGSSYLEAVECAKATLQGLINIGLLQKASLVMSPSMYEEDLVKSVVPQDGSGDLSFTRASDGTRINSAGLVEVCPWNLLLNTNTFSSWSLEGGTLTSGQTDPNGGTTAYKYVQTTGGIYSGSFTATSGNKTVSVWLKSVSGTSITCNLQDGGSSNSTTVTVTGNWQLFTFTYTTSTSRPALYVYSISNAAGIYLWHPQVNDGSTAKPYFPTTDRLNVPRLTYQNGGGGCPSLLLEPQRTNLILQSNTFNTTWAMFTGPAVTPNTTTSPDGTTSATTLNSSGGTNDFLYQTLSGLTVGATYSFSFYIKNLNSTASRFWGPSGSSIVDLSWSGSTLVSISGTGASFTSVGNDWYRVVQTGTTPTATPTMRIYADVNNTSKSVYIYGAQFEAGSYPTSYIPTTSASATRVADAYSRSLSSITAGTAYINITDNVALGSVGTHLYGPFSITSASLGIHLSRPNNQRLRLWTQASANVFQTTVTNLKLAITWDGTNVNVYQNGVKVVTNYSYALTNVNNLFSSTNLESSATIAEIVLFNSVLTDAECISLTS